MATGDPASLKSALADYQMERKPIVERFQEAAHQSQSYFESTSRYQDLEPEQFVFHLLTRSGRMDYGNLRQRDPFLIERVDRRFSTRIGGNERSSGRASTGSRPFDLGAVKLGNRVVLSPVFAGSSVDGVLAGVDREALVSALGASAGLVLTDEIAVSAHGRITPGDAGLYDDDQTQAFRGLSRQRADRVAVRLNHAGPRGSTKPRGVGLDRPLDSAAWPLVAASPVAYGRNATPAALDARTRAEILEDFTHRRSQRERAGFDAVVVEMGRGYLLGSFLSPLTNLRDDELGGDTLARMRFPLEVFDAVRERSGGRWEHRSAPTTGNAEVPRRTTPCNLSASCASAVAVLSR